MERHAVSEYPREYYPRAEPQDPMSALLPYQEPQPPVQQQEQEQQQLGPAQQQQQQQQKQLEQPEQAQQGTVINYHFHGEIKIDGTNSTFNIYMSQDPSASLGNGNGHN